MTLGTGATTASMAQLIRSNVWSDQLKEVLTDDMRVASKFVDWRNAEFSDGDTFNIPSLGQLSVFDYKEDEPIQFQSMDTGNFTFTITEYKGAGVYITQKARQDLHYAAQLEAMFVPEQSRALSQEVESFIFKQGQPGTPNGQTVSNTNLYNGAAHRWVGSDVRYGQRVLAPEDFSRARYSLKKANVPMTNLIAIVDPINAAVIETHPNFINFSSEVQFNDTLTNGMSSGFRWVKKIFGFEVYESNYLALSGTNQSGAAETIGGVTTGTNAVANLFFSGANYKPWVGAWRQMPKVDSGFDYKMQREEYVVTARYGVKLFYPENFVTILTDTGSIW